MVKEKNQSFTDKIDSRVQELTAELDLVRKKWREAMKHAGKVSDNWRKQLNKKTAEWKVQAKRAEEQAYKKALDFIKKKEAEKKKALLAAEAKFEKMFVKKKASPKKASSKKAK